MRQELYDQVDNAGEVDIDLIMELGEIKLGCARQAGRALHARVQKNTVQTRVLCDHPARVLVSLKTCLHCNESWGLQAEDLLLDESVDAIAVGDIELDCGGFGGTMLRNKGVQSVLAAADGNDLGALRNELVSQASTDARSRPDNEDGLVSEGHIEMRRLSHSWCLVGMNAECCGGFDQNRYSSYDLATSST
jgi:hypothetical protein